MALIALLLVVFSPAMAAPEAQPGDRVLGRAEAPITIIEYSSLTCPHCAKFHNTTLPQLEREYLNTGKAKLIFRDFPLDRASMFASVVAHCAPKKRYFAFLKVLFREQQQWARSPAPKDELIRIGVQGGLTRDKIEACLADDKLADSILKTRLEGQQTHNVMATPTFFVRGKAYRGALTFEEFDSILKPLLPGS
jgi:protein-disulfide isomerase